MDKRKVCNDTPKLLLPLGREKRSILHYNLKNCLEITSPEDVYVLTKLRKIGNYVNSVDSKINVVYEPETHIGRGSGMKYTVEEGLLPRRDIVTVNASDLCTINDLKGFAEYEGSAFLVARKYFAEYPSSKPPNVVHIKNGIITHIKRESYTPSDTTGIHTGISRLSAAEYDRLFRIPLGSETEDTVFKDILEEGRLGAVGPIETWLPLKIPEHVQAYENLDIEKFRKRGVL